MTYDLLKFAHILGAILMGAGLVGVWMADLRSRQLRDLQPFAEAVRNIAVCYDGLVVPGALLLLASGAWMIARFYGGLAFLGVPWLAGMVALFIAEFIEAAPDRGARRIEAGFMDAVRRRIGHLGRVCRRAHVLDSPPVPVGIRSSGSLIQAARIHPPLPITFSRKRRMPRSQRS